MKPVVLPVLIYLLFLSGTTLAGNFPFDEGDVSAIVRLAKRDKAVSYKRLAMLVDQNGIDFEPRESYLEELRKDGAKEVLLDALRSAKRENQPGGDARYFTSLYSVGGEDKSLVPIYKPEPPYPESARRARINGVVVLWVVIGPAGNVVDIKEISKPLGGGLDETTIHAVSKWMFEPPMHNGGPAAFHTAIETSFRTF